jgi:replicative DNA helicase
VSDITSLQIISKILETGSNAIAEENFLTEDYFPGYEKEFNFIQEHIRNYGNVPDKATFLSNFPDIELVEVAETDKYLVDAIREERLFQQATPILKKMADILTVDSNAAVEYMMSQLSNLQPNYDIGGVDIIAQGKKRLEQFKERKANPKAWFIETGLPELDEQIDGLQRGEELFVIFARTNQGKSWVLEKICSHAWKLGFNVGYFSPEMSDNSIGFRFDTLFNHYSNRALFTGGSNVDEGEYEAYIQSLSEKQNKFVVSTPKDFQHYVTVSKLKNWVRKYKLDIIGIDGIKYLSDERGRKGDNITTSLTNISEDLMNLSLELGIPVLVVVQANRSGVVGEENEGTPELETIRDSDGIAQNASKAISVQQKKDNVLEIGVKKGRNVKRGGKLKYTWDIDTGSFVYLPSIDDAEPTERTRKKVDEQKDKYKSRNDVF